MEHVFSLLAFQAMLHLRATAFVRDIVTVGEAPISVFAGKSGKTR
jgi:hypothetical protein